MEKGRSPIFRFFSPLLVGLRIPDSFVRNVAVMMSGTTLAMVIPVVATPVLTRLYSPGDYGVFALYVSIITALSVLVTAGYDSALMLPKEDDEALNLAVLCMVATVVASLLLLLVLWLFSGYADRLSGSSISRWLIWVPVASFIMGFQQTVSSWANRKRLFKALATNRVTESVVTPGLNIGLGLSSSGVGGLIAGLIIGKAFAAIALTRGLWTRRGELRAAVRKETMLRQTVEYREFPLFFAPTSFLDILAPQVPVILLSKFFGPAVVGLFSLTVRVIGAPLTLLSNCVWQVYYQWAAEARYSRKESRNILKVAFYLLLIIIGPVIAVVLFAPRLFLFIFGQEWGIAGEYARIVILPLAARFVVFPLTAILPATGNVKMMSMWKIGYFLTTSVTLCIASHFGVKTFLYAYCIHDLVLYGIGFGLVLKVSSQNRSFSGTGSLRQ
jgi:O-antigen/teichoic acid export membrane protein